MLYQLHRGRGKAVPQPQDERCSQKHHPSFPPPWRELWNRFFSKPLAQGQDRERLGKEPAETWRCHPEPPCAPSGKTHPKPCLCQWEAKLDGCWRVLCGPLISIKTPWEADDGENMDLVY